MIGTANCTYETPCGWCTKWDKKCDMKMPERGKRAEINPIDDYSDITLTNKTCQSEEDHQWECCGMSTGGSTYRCKICGQYKTEPVKNSDNTTISTYFNYDTDRSCSECYYEGYDMPHCKDCDASNNFKHFEGWENV